MNYATVCSGIEAPTVAWHGLGLTPVWFSEIEPLPCKLLKHHYPYVPNLGDMTKLNEHETYRNTTIDLLCGGTPCQSFSIAGLRGGLDDERGNLALEYCRILIAKRPRWFVWENVPGVFSSNGGKDFACILSAFTGTEVNAAGLGNAGIIQGELYSVAWRVLDAQYFGVPQRRRRVFVIGYTGNNWRAPYAVLFEPESLRRDFTPRREKGQNTTGTVESDTANSSWWNGEQQTHTLTKNNANGAQRMPDNENLRAVLQSFGLDEDKNGWVENAGTLRNHKSGGREHSVVYNAIQTKGPCAKQTCIAVIENNGKFYTGSNWCKTPQSECPRKDMPSGVGYELCKSVCNQNAHAEVDACQVAGENAKGGTLYLVGHTYCCENCKKVMAEYGIKDVVIGYLPQKYKQLSTENAICLQGSMIGRLDENGPQGDGLNNEVSFTLNKTDKHAVVYDTTQITSPQNGSNPTPELCHPLCKGQHVPLVTLTPVCFQQNTRDEVRLINGDGHLAGALMAEPGMKQQNYLATNSVARRLTPLECERLQGFPDNYTNIPGATGWRNAQPYETEQYCIENNLKYKVTKAGKIRVQDADGPRYAAIGNSMAVPVMRWIGERIVLMDKVLNNLKTKAA